MLIYSIIIAISLLIITGFFSACETAMTSASKAKLHQMAKDGDKRAIIAKKLHENLGAVVSVALTCNTMINTWIASILSKTMDSFISNYQGITYVVMSMAVPFVIGALILIYGEVTPKMAALYNPEKFVHRTSKLVMFFFNFMRPVNNIITYMSRASLRMFGVKVSDKEDYASLEELRGVIDMHQGPGEDVSQERAMLKSILDLRSVDISDIMVHRKNVTMVNADNPISVIVDQVLSCPFTRLPVYKQTLDENINIIGVLNSKSLLSAINKHKGDLDSLDIRDILKAPWFVPESNDLLDQLQAFRDKREHLAIVVDELGEYLGVVTLEDILEEIVGEIDDEHDIRVRGVKTLTDGSYLIEGGVTIRDLNRKFDWNLPEERASTIAGFVFYNVGIIPEIDQIFIFNDFRFQVTRRKKNQITQVKVKPLFENKTENNES